jgi:hypothetical protein
VVEKGFLTLKKNKFVVEKDFLTLKKNNFSVTEEIPGFHTVLSGQGFSTSQG